MSYVVIKNKESWLSSIAKDVFTFGAMGFLLYANHRWLGDKTYIGITMIFLIILFATTKASNRSKTFEKKEDAVNYIQSL